MSWEDEVSWNDLSYPESVDKELSLTEVRKELRSVRDYVFQTENELRDKETDHLQASYELAVAERELESTAVLVEKSEESGEIISLEDLVTPEAKEEAKSIIRDRSAKIQRLERQIDDYRGKIQDARRYMELLEARENILIDRLHQGPAEQALTQMISGLPKISMALSGAVIALMGTFLISTHHFSEDLYARSASALIYALFAIFVSIVSFGPDIFRYGVQRMKGRTSEEWQRSAWKKAFWAMVIFVIIGFTLMVFAIWEAYHVFESILSSRGT